VNYDTSLGLLTSLRPDLICMFWLCYLVVMSLSFIVLFMQINYYYKAILCGCVGLYLFLSAKFGWRLFT